jgi:hypothetical protein
MVACTSPLLLNECIKLVIKLMMDNPTIKTPVNMYCLMVLVYFAEAIPALVAPHIDATVVAVLHQQPLGKPSRWRDSDEKIVAAELEMHAHWKAYYSERLMKLLSLAP